MTEYDVWGTRPSGELVWDDHMTEQRAVWGNQADGVTVGGDQVIVRGN